MNYVGSVQLMYEPVRKHEVLCDSVEGVIARTAVGGHRAPARRQRSLVRWFVGSLVRWFVGSLVRWFVGSLGRWFVGSLGRWVVGSFMHALGRLPVRSVVGSFIGPFVRSFVDSFVRWVIH